MDPQKVYNFRESYKWNKVGYLSVALDLIAKGCEAIELTGVRLGEEGTKSLMKALRGNTTCRALHMCKCDIGPGGAIAVAELLSDENMLHYLYLYDNNIGDEGALAISKSLISSSASTLEYLSLSNNNIGNKGAEYLASFLKSNNSLLFLGLGSNKIGDEGAAFLAEGLKVNTSLIELVLSYNSIGVLGDKALAEALKVNNTLTYLSLHQDTILTEGAQALADALKVNKTIKYFGLAIYTNDSGKYKPMKRNIDRLLKRNVAEQRKSDETHRQAFEEAVKYDGKGPWNRSKVMVVGKGRAGKTATIRSLQNLVFVPDLPSTVGAAITETHTHAKSQDLGWVKQDHSKVDYTTELAARISISRVHKEEAIRRSARHSARSSASRMSAKRLIQRISDKRSSPKRFSHSRHSKTRHPGQPIDSSHESESVEMRHSVGRLNGSQNRDNGRHSATRAMIDFLGHQMDGIGRRSHERGTRRRASSVLSNRSRAGSRIRSRSRSGSRNSVGMRDIEEAMPALPPVLDTKQISERINEHTFLNAREEHEPISFQIWDYGGQSVFYSLHHLFLTCFGIYLVIFDMKHFLQDEKAALDYLKFWLYTIKLHAADASVLVVGTFLDAVHSYEELQKINAGVATLLTKFPHIVKNIPDKLLFFPVDNKNGGKGIRAIREVVEKVTRTQPYVRQDVSLRWTRCLDKVLEAGKEQNYVKLKDVRDIAKELGIISSEEVDKMLNFFTELGVILHLTGTESLKNFITTDPQWLVASLTQVLRDPKLHPYDEAELVKVGLDGDMKSLITDGIATVDLLEYVWNSEHVNFLTDLMRESMLLSDWRFGKETAYLIPSMVVKEYTQSKIQSCAGYECIFDFSEGILPGGVFERLVCLCVEESSFIAGSSSPELYKSFAKVYLGARDMFYMRHSGDTIVISVKEATIAGKVLFMMLDMMRKLQGEVMGKGLMFQVELGSTNQVCMPLDFARENIKEETNYKEPQTFENTLSYYNFSVDS